MLAFNLKKYYYRQVRDGLKTHEYRPANSYWSKRINNLSIGDDIKLTLGYTSIGVVAKIVSIKEVHVDEIPIKENIKSIYSKKYRYYHDIKFKLQG